MRHRFFFLILGVFTLAAAAQWSRAEDLTGRFGLSTNVGGVWPLAPDYVTHNVDDSGLNVGVTASFDVGSHIGMAISYDHVNLGDNLDGSLLNVLFRTRLFPERQWTPTLDFGPGSAKGVNSTRMENLSFKAILGLDYFVTTDWAVGPQLGYLFISHSGDASTYVHLMTFGFRAAYYFGRTS